MSKTPAALFDKVWDSHVVKHIDDGPDVLFIDRHFMYVLAGYPDEVSTQ